jgi:hypothetical protein
MGALGAHKSVATAPPHLINQRLLPTVAGSLWKGVQNSSSRAHLQAPRSRSRRSGSR